MKKFFNWIENHVTLKDIFYWIIIGFILILLSSAVRTCQNNEDQYKNNLYALTDTITYYQSQNGSLIASKTAFESNIKELKLANSELYSELEDMKLKLKNVSNASHFEGNMDFGEKDTVYLIQETESNYFIKQFDFSNQWRILNGQVSLKNDSLSVGIKNDKVNFDYTVVMDKDNKIYVKSNNPYVTYTEFSGFTIPKEKKKYFSVGPGISVGYDPFLNKPTYSIGVVANWKAFEF